MAKLHELVSYADSLLQIELYRDYCPNGLQVEGHKKVDSIVSGVTASQALLDAAAEVGADLVLVHHGYFWKGEDPCVIGIKKRRINRLLANNMSLLAYHLPLDGNDQFGNNVTLARKLDIGITGKFGPGEPLLGRHGHLAVPMSAEDWAGHLTQRLGRTPLHIAGSSPQISHVAWCSGAAQGYIEQAYALGVDAFLSGEISEQTVHLARELGIHYFSAGHHATERYGVQALGQHLAEQFSITHQFIDIDNPV